MSVTAEFLREIGAGLSEREFVELLRVAAPDPHAQERAPLSPNASAFLAEHGGIPERDLAPAPPATVGAPRPNDPDSPFWTMHEWSRVVTSSRSVVQVAAMLGRDQSRVRHMIADGALHALTAERTRLLPAWQFEGTKPLPHLRAILAELPGDLHPLELEGWMTTPAPELEVGDVALSPRDWLASGGNPEMVLALARDVDLS